MTGKQFFQTLAGSLTAWISNFLEQLFGPGVRNVVYARITWADLIVTGLLLLVVLVVIGLVSRLLRGKMQPPQTPSEDKSWRSLICNAVCKPLYLLIWTYGIYFAVTPLVLRLGTGEGVHPAQAFLDKAFDVGVFAALFWLFIRGTRVIDARLELWAKKSESKIDDVLVPLLGQSLRVLVPVLGLIFALPVIGLSTAYNNLVSKASSLLIIGTVAWVLIQVVGAVKQLVLGRFDIKAADNFEARKVYTQMQVITRMLYVVIAIFSVASALMLFEEVRRLGTSILASAGVVGIIVGFAAQRTIANLFAGLQLALTQPIRIDDAVVVEGEFGNVEEITLTYVVVRVWDKRRLIVPLSYFIEKPFQNWTRTSTDVLGTVEVYADYTLPLAEIRQEVQRIVEASPRWDRKTLGVQVTGATERAMQIRVLIGAADAGKAWDLRCEIREKLLEFIQKSHPESLPKERTSLDGSERFYNRIARVNQKAEARPPEADFTRENRPADWPTKSSGSNVQT